MIARPSFLEKLGLGDKSMRVKTVKLVEFKRFDDLTIDLGPNPKKLLPL